MSSSSLEFGVGRERRSDRQILAEMGHRISRAIRNNPGLSDEIADRSDTSSEVLTAAALDVRSTMRFDDGNGPNDGQWNAMARMAVELVVIEQRRWGSVTGAELVSQMKEVAKAALRAEPGGERSLVQDPEYARGLLVQAFKTEQRRRQEQMAGSSAQPDGFAWAAVREKSIDTFFLHVPLFNAWELHPKAKNMTVIPGKPPIYELDGGHRLAGSVPVATSPEELRRVLQFLASPSGIEPKTWNPDRPELELAMHDGSRLTAVIDPIAPNGPFVAIRRHLRPSITLEDYCIDNPSAVPLLAALMAANMSFLIVGGTNSGKTTMLRALGSCFGEFESVVVAESVQELRYENHPEIYGRGIYPLLAQPPGVTGGGVSLGECVTIAQRMSPDRIVVGEIRGPEVQGLVTAAKMGHPILSTIHGASTHEGVLNLARSHEQFTNARFENSLAQMCSALDVVVSIAAINGRFVVTSIGLVNGLATNQTVPEISELYGARADHSFGPLVDSTVNLKPAYRQRLDAVGVNDVLAGRVGGGSAVAMNGHRS